MVIRRLFCCQVAIWPFSSNPNAKGTSGISKTRSSNLLLLVLLFPKNGVNTKKMDCIVFLSCFFVSEYDTHIVTGRNEVLAKVIFSQACVCPQGEGYPSMPCRSVPRGGVSQHALQVSPRGGLQFFGEGGFMPIFRCLVPGVSNFLGGSPIFRGVSISNFFWGGGLQFSGGLQFFWGCVWFRGSRGG